MAKKIDLNVIRDRYFETGRDKLLTKYVDKLRSNAKAMEKGRRGSQRRSLFVIGDTGSGKTRSIERIIALVPEWQSSTDQYGDEVNSLIPSPAA